MVEPILIDGRQAWLKHYRDGGSRLLSLGALKFIADKLGIDPLRPPPHHVGAGALDTEARRLSELAAQRVHVPEVIGRGRASLVLSDNGKSLASWLRNARDDAQCDQLVRLALEAMAKAHAQGAYLGQPLPRNMTYDGQRIGFIDFEEDPLEVMNLAQAQARDWLMFGYGVARYYERRPEALQALMHEAMARDASDVQQQTHRVTGRLQRLAAVCNRLGRKSRRLAHALLVLHAASTFSVLIIGTLAIDWFSDGDLDVLRLLLG
ncbi:serine/threonine protein phosphatase [Pseudoxanthomonas sp. USHLN014]|uniref:serine/threonine protein phosphatase n=1 Tax=Pseudoxanthomonas sp. USHLN014 TaxID=3081297 RepID=UPI00301E0756